MSERKLVEVGREWIYLSGDTGDNTIRTISIGSSIEDTLANMIEGYRINTFKAMEYLRAKYPDMDIVVSPYRAVDGSLDLEDFGLEVQACRHETDEEYFKRTEADRIKEEKAAARRESQRKARVGKLALEAERLGLKLINQEGEEL